MMLHLHPSPARTDLTSRECAKLLGAVIGGLIQMAPRQAIKDALLWWIENLDSKADQAGDR